MPLRPPAGFIRPGFDPLKNPNAPTIGAATGGDASASVAFTPPANVGGSAISAYFAVSTPGQITASAASSPVSVTGLTNGTAYTFAVWALNTYGPGPFSAASGSVTPQSQRGVFAGGNNSGNTPQSTVQYISIPSTGNAINYGSLTVARYSFAGVGSTTRGVFACGFRLTNGDPTFFGTVDYIEIASDGNATNFGTALSPSRQAIAACSNSTRGVFAGGADFNRYAVMQFVTIATTGTNSTFGNLTDVTNRLAGCASPTRGVFGGGFNSGGPTRNIQFITIATTGNATSFGLLASAILDLASCSSSTRGIFAGGDATSLIQFVTIASTGNATTFGNLPAVAVNVTGVSSEIRGVFGGNVNTGSSVMQFITIATTGNSATFGNLVSSTWDMAGCSNCSGGVQ